jgi:hypothetical protein
MAPRRRLALALLLAGAAAYGLASTFSAEGLPRDHKQTRAGRYTADRDAAWAALSALDGPVAWRSDLTGREQLPDVRGHAVWRETWPDGESVSWETVEAVGSRKLVRCVVDQGADYGGCWTIEVAPRASGSVVTVTEQLTIHDAWYARTHTVEDRRERLDAFLEALGAQLGGAPRLADDARALRDEPAAPPPP